MQRSLIAMMLCAAACGGDDPPGDVDAGSGDALAVPDAATGCQRSPAPADRARYVVVSHPYGEGGAQATDYEVLGLSVAGELSQLGVTFAMGRATDGVIAFTPDGEVGMLAQNDGTLGVFTLDGQGMPTVIDAAYDGGDAFYASGVVVAPNGSHAYVLDGNWRENGGGIYRIAIECDGSLTNEGLIAAAKLPAGLVFAPEGGALLAADDVLDSTAGDSAFAIELAGTPAVLGGADAFGDDLAIVGSAAVTAGGDYFLIGDTSQFSGLPNRVAVVGVTGTSLTAVQVLTPLEDPYAIVTSPFGDGALVVSGFGDAIFELDFDQQDTAAPFSIAGELAYTGGAPQLPGRAVMIERGTLRGLVLISENQGVRRVHFNGGGAIEDLGLTSFASGLPAIVGAIGVQP